MKVRPGSHQRRFALPSRKPGLRVLLAAAVALGLSPGAAAAGSIPELPEPSPQDPYTVVQEGISVRLEMEHLDPSAGPDLREGDDILFRFEVKDTTTGQPLGGLYPAAWMDLAGDARGSDPALCNERVEEFAGGSLLARAELDLNVYYVLALNQDATISVVDPLFGYGDTRLLALIRLQSPGEDWVASADGKRLFVSLPESDRLAVVDTAAWKVIAELPVGKRPTTVALQPDGTYLWVAFEGETSSAPSSGVTVLDTRTLKIVARIVTGAGPHEIAFRADSRFAWVTNRNADTVSMIDVHDLRLLRQSKTGKGPASVAFSPLAAAVYVTHEGDGTIVALDAATGEVAARMQSRPGLGQIRFPPDSRFGLAVNPETDTLSIVDVALNQIVQTGEMLSGPDQIAFTDELAYIRHRGSENVLMIPLDQIGVAGDVVPVVDFPGGEHPFGRGVRPSRAAAIVQAPGAVAVLIANPADQVIYYYKEGMAAPMGHFKNYDREPRAVLAIDRSLREKGRPGVYETAAKLRSPGRYVIAFLLDTPRIVHCFDAEVLADPELEAQRLAERPLTVETLFSPHEVAPGSPVRAKFRLRDPATGQPSLGLKDVQILAYSTNNWQQREWAKEIEPGIYESSFTFPDPGIYFLTVEALSGRLPYQSSPRVPLRVTPP